MEREDLDLSLVQPFDGPMRTLTASLSFAEDRSFVSFADPRPGEPNLAELVSNYDFRHLHVHWLGQLWDHPSLIEMARKQGASISLDCQCCPDVMLRPDLPEKLGLVDVFMPNRVEALQVAGTDDLEEALRKLASQAPTVIIKLGGEGVVACQDDEEVRMRAMPVDAVDTTGAGDAFAGGYIYGLLSGMSFAELPESGHNLWWPLHNGKRRCNQGSTPLSASRLDDSRLVITI